MAHYVLTQIMYLFKSGLLGCLKGQEDPGAADIPPIILPRPLFMIVFPPHSTFRPVTSTVKTALLNNQRIT
jgi:hypothetical protein